MYGIGIGGLLPVLLSRTSAALSAQALQGTSIEKHPNRILVVVELSHPAEAEKLMSAQQYEEFLKTAGGH